MKGRKRRSIRKGVPFLRFRIMPSEHELAVFFSGASMKEIIEDLGHFEKGL
jgi:hypothetical protein